MLIVASVFAVRDSGVSQSNIGGDSGGVRLAFRSCTHFGIHLHGYEETAFKIDFEGSEINDECSMEHDISD